VIGLRLRRRLQLGFGIPIAILIVLTVVSYRSVVAVIADATRARHPHQVVEKLAELLAAMQDAEAGAYGFALAGDESFLVSYDDGLVKAPAALAALGTLTATNPAQQRSLARLAPLVSGTLQAAGEVVRLRRDAGAQAASERAVDGDGIRSMVSVRGLLGDMRDEEERLLVEREAIADRAFERLTLALSLPIIGAIVVLGLAGFMVSRDTAARWKSEQALRASEERSRQERDRAQRYLDTAEVILLALDRDARITLINRKGCDLLGWGADELLGCDWIETCLPTHLRDTFRVTLHALMRGDLPIGENPVLTRSGEERLIEWRNTLLRDDAGRVVGTLSSGSDITARARAEEEIRQSARRSADAEREFRELFASNPLPMWIYDLATLQFLEVNGAAVRRYGYSRDGFLAMTIADIRAPADVDGLLGDAGQPRETWQHAGGWRHRLESGQVIDVDITSHTIGFAGQRAALVVAQDITERKRAEEAIRYHARLSALSAAVGLALTVTDSLVGALQQCSEALVTHLDAAFARIWTLNERAGVLELQASFGLYTHVNGPHGKVALGQFKIGRIARDRKPHLTNTVLGDPEVNDQEWARREGMVAFAGHPLIVEGRVVGVMALFARHALSDAAMSTLGSVADHIALGIERHRSAEALQTVEERTRFALVTAGVGIWDMDYATGVLQWSETLESQYGLQKGTFRGTFDAFVERIHPDDRATVLETVGKAVQSGRDFSVLNRAVWPDGTVRWLSGGGRVLLGKQGEPVRAVGISLDITESHSLEEQFHQAQKMEVIGQLAGGVAHDFNSQLTVILGYCELLLAESDSDDRRSDITEIQKAGMRAAALTRQLLTFSRKEIIEPTRLDLNAVVSEMCAMVGRLIGEDVAIELDLQPELAAVKADRGQVEQIVMNLAINAGDAMPGGGTLTIETANVELGAAYVATHPAVRPGPYVLLTVSDTGTGMTPQVQARLFEPFFTTKEVGKGTGLGLATVQGTVMRIGGTVDVDSEIGRGTSFRMYFPKMDTAGTVVETPPSPQRRAGTQTVLVVDDDPALCLLTKRLLEQQGYTVVLAADAEEALQLFDRDATIDLLLTDVVMPGTSGPQLTRLLLEKQPTLKVVYMSGYAQEAIARLGIVEPGITLVRKPFTSEALAQKLCEALDA
jgi:two-component system, cell cycle sensor histidine kinase and response regulator CckA